MLLYRQNNQIRGSIRRRTVKEQIVTNYLFSQFGLIYSFIRNSLLLLLISSSIKPFTTNIVIVRLKASVSLSFIIFVYLSVVTHFTGWWWLCHFDDRDWSMCALDSNLLLFYSHCGNYSVVNACKKIIDVHFNQPLKIDSWKIYFFSDELDSFLFAINITD